MGDPRAPTGAAFLLAPARPLEQALTDARRLFFLTLAGTGTLAAAAAILLFRTLVRPLRLLEQATRAMARGDYQARVPLTGGDEVGRLATAINTLASSLLRYDRTRREFLANVAHELRTPLSYLDPALPIRQAVSALLAFAQTRGLHLTVTLPPNLPPVLGGGARLQQVVINLLDNALRHTPGTPSPFPLPPRGARSWLR